ncbi:hypothetical protein CIPAW_05G196300 [Carya illinoinensis]|uniref:Uncharacterized protein n=1 Tax=Carya illinoinensis TaxID=32201 RepID=A0A8T1QKX9_CARIL|nr:hypothetical protein CIPAW_05G196300 [Carya illinoinensis]
MPSLMNIALLFLKHIFFDFFVVQKFSRKGKTVHYALGPSYSLPKAGCWMHGGSGSLSFNKQRQYLFSIMWHLFFMQILTPYRNKFWNKCMPASTHFEVEVESF